MTTEPNPTDPATPGPDRRPRHRAYSFPEGVIYATVWPATRDHGDVVARIEVTCHPGTVSGAEPFVYLTIRGRDYAMAELYRRVTARLDPAGWSTDGSPTPATITADTSTAAASR